MLKALGSHGYCRNTITRGRLPPPPPQGGGPFGSAVALSGAFMVAGAPASESAWVTAVHKPAPYDEWMAHNFTAEYLEDPFAAPGEDADLDGLSNLLELGLGFDPATSDEGPGAPAGIRFDTTAGVGGQSQYLTLTVSLPEPPPTGMSYLVEASTDLEFWERIATRSPAGVWTGAATVAEEIGRDGRLEATVRDTVAISAAGTRYLRLRVSILNP